MFETSELESFLYVSSFDQVYRVPGKIKLKENTLRIVTFPEINHSSNTKRMTEGLTTPQHTSAIVGWGWGVGVGGRG